MNRSTLLGIGVAVLSAGCGNPSSASNAGSSATAISTESIGSPAIAGLSNGTWQSIDANVIASLKHELVGVGQLDGRPVTGVELRSKCETLFATDQGSTVINWAKVGDFAGQVEGGVASIPINDGTAQHVFTIPDGPSFRRVDGSLGLLADECEKAG